MDHLRTIESHDHQLAREHVQHHQDTNHQQDKHEVDMTRQGLSEFRAIQQASQGAEKHDATIKNMTAPKPETVQ
jgi:hypothetical protein